ncbi:DUF3488 domain-containing protein [Lujinxingia sediminis]|uniref:DUF3488 domain-containing protein n=1 Tax=Lujinxingia sediminis TaxID=2480984 RepID=A0ABY0CTN9_9DELT|nr:DUF3488 and transglutaminase-like domain-containing protein [Lujinxingia sediminis]RVU44165.1 DUF3488 domain-containing protein [Lujinxingia sediminis]
MTPFVQRLERLHAIFLYISLALAFLAVVFGGAAGAGMLVVFPLFALGAPAIRHVLPGLIRQNWLWNILILTVLVLTIAEYLTNPLADIIALGIRFVLVLILIKLISRRGPRDELQLHALSLLTFAAASAANEGLSFGLLFGAYILSGTFTMALFHLKSESERRPLLQSPRKSPFDRFYVSVLAGISLAIFASSLLIFFTFPRVGLGLFVTQSRESLSVAGFSEDVELGSHGVLRSNPQVVMRVEFPEAAPPTDIASMRWRAMTFDSYDGRRWSRTLAESERPAPYNRNASYDLEFLRPPPLDRLLANETPRQVQIYLEPLGTNILPTLWPPATIELGLGEMAQLIGTRAASLTRDHYGDLRHTMDSELGLTYSLGYFDAPPPTALQRIEGRMLDARLEDMYTQLPENFDSRIGALAREITATSGDPYSSAGAIAGYFAREFTYTTDLPEVDPDQPIASFLFETRAGHCEYFATAAALMLRSQGIPTRLVNGFLGGTWNEVGDYLTVRQGDAHAWIEVFVPDLGWVPVEATPAIESGFGQRSAWMRLGADAYDAMRQAWFKWVLEYDIQAQIAVLRRVARVVAPQGAPSDRGSSAEEDREQETIPLKDAIFGLGWLTLMAASGWRGATGPARSPARRALGISMWMGLGALWVSWFLGWSIEHALLGAFSVGGAFSVALMLVNRPQKMARYEVSRAFETIARAGARRGLERRDDEGPQRYLERVAASLDEAGRGHVEAFQRRYLNVRFGGGPYGPAQARELRRHARQVVLALRRAAR